VRITRLQLRNIRKHADLDLELAPGLTVVRGPNESGKSTLQRAIELALTRRVTSGSADLDALRTWNADEDDRPWVRLEFEQEDLDGVRTGALEKAFRGARGTVKLEIDGETVTDPARADDLLGELTGIPSEAFFRSTASIRHHELDGLARDEAALRDRLQASISGADRGTSRARRKLERALYELNTKGDKNPGRIKAAEAALATAAAAQRNGEAALVQLETDRDALAQAREDRAIAEAELATQRGMLEKARLAERLIAERDQARERFERYTTAVEVAGQVEQLEGSHPSPNGLPALREALGKVRAADVRIREIKAALAGEVEVNFVVNEPTPRSWRPTAIAALALVLLAIGIVAADQLNALPRDLRDIVISVAGQTLSLPGVPVLAGLLLLFSIILAWVGRRQRIRAMDVRKTRDLRTQEIERRLRGRSMLEQELQMEEVTLSNLLAALELPDLVAVEALVAAEEAHMTNILKLRAQLEGLVGREPAQTLPELRSKAALDVEQKTAAIEELGAIAREPRARERLEVAVAEADRVVGRARDVEAQARARVEQNPVDAEEVAGHAERAALWAEQLAALQRRARVYDATLKAMDAAERATIRTATRYLEKRMVVDLERVTAGRYRRVRVDDENLGLRVYAPERGDWVDVSTLSQGTLDTVYLAARIGLVRLVTGDRRPPLVMDDPFVTLDDERAARALSLLHDVSTDFQVIYLTTSDRYDATADKVVELAAPTALTPDSVPDDAPVDAPEAAPQPAANDTPAEAPVAVAAARPTQGELGLEAAAPAAAPAAATTPESTAGGG
jgi:DNA repair exonuclease SbcCD ATPase subunit